MKPHNRNAPEASVPAVAQRLGLWDTVSIIVGVVVGTAIFRSSTLVFQNVSGPASAITIWLVGGTISWCGAVCYAELATTFPRDGGDYEYLSRAFGRWCGFLFGWAQLTTVVSGNIAIVAYAFSDYAVRVWPSTKEFAVALVVVPIVALSLLNACGIVAGKATQNLLSAVKVIGLTGIVLAGLLASATRTLPTELTQQPPTLNLGLALVFVLYAFGGWNHAAYVAAEVRDERRNLPRALILGIAAVTLIYVAVTAAYLAGLGIDGARRTPTPAAEVVELAVGPWGGRAISILVMLSALGAINGMILTATRIYATLGSDYPAFRWLGTWNREAAPVAAIAAQAAVAVLLVLVVGTGNGRSLCDATLRAVGLQGLPWHKYFGGFETLVAGSAPVFWAFFLLTGVAVFVLRIRYADHERPFKIPFFPLPPIVFCLACSYMLCSSLDYARWLTLLGLAPLALGALLACLLRPGSGSKP